MSIQVELDTKLFVGGLCSHTTSDSLREYYEQWGQIIDCVVMHSRGFGFVTFIDKESTDRCMLAVPHKIDGKVVDAKRATRKQKFGSGNEVSNVYARKIFVGGIYGKLGKTDLIKYFSQFGEVTSCSIYADEITGESRGFGFLIFEEPASVDRTLSIPHHIAHGIELDVKKAQPREETSSMSGFSSDAGSENIPNHLIDKARLTSRRYSASMHPRLLSNFSAESGPETRSFPSHHSEVSSVEDNPWANLGARKSMPPKSSANLKSLNEAIQAERAFNRQKITNAEEKILELERKLILKEKECCDLKEKLLYEHQRQTIEMAQGLMPSYYCDPQGEPSTSDPAYSAYAQASTQSYSYEPSPEQPYSSYDQSSGLYTYENAFQDGWMEFPKPEPIWTNLSADAQEFTLESGKNTNNLIAICNAPEMGPSGLSHSDIPGTSSQISRMDSTTSANVHSLEGGYALNERESGYASS